jgi:antitoxin (DNA-binding transcriptional repressor) of toxin-antitoxin stability system
MKELSISDVRSHLPALLKEVTRSRAAFVVTRYGKAIASIVPFQPRKECEVRYPLRNRPIAVTEDFDAPMPDLWEALTAKEGRGTYATRRSRCPRRKKGTGKK